MPRSMDAPAKTSSPFDAVDAIEDLGASLEYWATHLDTLADCDPALSEIVEAVDLVRSVAPNSLICGGTLHSRLDAILREASLCMSFDGDMEDRRGDIEDAFAIYENLFGALCGLRWFREGAADMDAGLDAGGWDIWPGLGLTEAAALLVRTN